MEFAVTARFFIFGFALALSGCLTSGPQDYNATAGSSAPLFAEFDRGTNPRSFLATTHPSDARESERSALPPASAKDEPLVLWHVSTRNTTKEKQPELLRAIHESYETRDYHFENVKKGFWRKNVEVPKFEPARVLNHDEFNTSIAASPRTREVLLYVHGFNNSPDIAFRRVAELTRLLEFSGAPFAFTWPAHGGVSWYLYDLQSANISRDALANLLRDLSQNQNVSRIHIFAHSMGSWLTMEALRQTALAGQSSVLDKISDVILFAPDLDPQVFERQITVVNASIESEQPLGIIGNIRALAMGSPVGRNFARRISVFAGKDDLALRLSGWLSGVSRLGTNTDQLKQKLATYGVNFTQTDRFTAEDWTSHYKAADPRAIELIRTIVRRPDQERALADIQN